MKQKFLNFVLIASLVFAGFIPAITASAADVGFNYVKQIGSINGEGGQSLAVDSSGNVYVTGYFKGTIDFDPGSGTTNLVSAGDYDAYVTKFDSSGNLVWAKSMGGTGDDGGRAIAVDSSGNVYSSGQFNATADFDPGAGTSNLTPAGSYDIFISKLDSSGNFIWAKKMGGTGYSTVNGIALDSSSNVYTTGIFDDTSDFDPGAGTSNLVSAGGNDIYISKLDSSGTFVFAKRIGGTDYDYGRSIVLDSSSNIFVSGYFRNTVDFDPGAGTSNLVSAGGSDAFVVKLDSSGAYSWSKQVGNTGNDGSYDIALDSGSNIYVAGFFVGTVDFDPGAGTSNQTAAGSGDSYILKLDSSGTYVWAKTMGSTSNDGIYTITIDSSDNIYSAGYFDGTIDLDPGVGVSNATTVGVDDMFITKLDSSGTFVWGKTFGGVDYDFIFGIGVDSSFNVYTTGYFENTVDFDPGSSVYNVSAVAGAFDDDIFLLRLSPLVAPTVTSSPASSVTLTSATMNGNITSTGGESNTARGFQYGLTGQYGSTKSESGSFSTGAFSSNLTDLKCSTRYFYRAFSTNSVGTSYGDITPFDTPSCPGATLPQGGGSFYNPTVLTPNTSTTSITPPTGTSQPTPTTITSLTTGLTIPSTPTVIKITTRLVKVSTTPTIYRITEYSKKLAFPSLSSFTSYGHSNKNVEIITPEELSKYPDVKFIKLATSPLVYQLENNVKHGITAEAAARFNINETDIHTVSRTHLNAYKTGESILY